MHWPLKWYTHIDEEHSSGSRYGVRRFLLTTALLSLFSSSRNGPMAVRSRLTRSRAKKSAATASYFCFDRSYLNFVWHLKKDITKTWCVYDINRAGHKLWKLRAHNQEMIGSYIHLYIFPPQIISPRKSSTFIDEWYQPSTSQGGHHSALCISHSRLRSIDLYCWASCMYIAI